MGSKKSTRKQFRIIGIVALIICVGLSGCNQISNVFLTDEDKLVGTWNCNKIPISVSNIPFDVPSILVFLSNGTFQIDIGIPNSPIDFTLNGKWDISDRIFIIEIVDLIPPTNYTYQFSEDNKTLEITDIESNELYILRKQ